jgi:hypothetical protein
LLRYFCSAVLPTTKVRCVFVLADTAGYRSIQTTQYYVTVNHEMRPDAAGDCELVCVFADHRG